MLYRQFRMLRGHYAKMTRGLFPKRIIRYAGLTEPPMCTSAYLANVRPDHISSSYWFRSKKCSACLLARTRVWSDAGVSPPAKAQSPSQLTPLGGR